MKNIMQCISSGKHGQTMPEKHAVPSAPGIHPDLVCSLTFQTSRGTDEVKRKSKRPPASLFHKVNKSKPLPHPQRRPSEYTHTYMGCKMGTNSSSFWLMLLHNYSIVSNFSSLIYLKSDYFMVHSQ